MLEYLVPALAVVGAALGILNTWQNFRRDCVRIKITPTIHCDPKHGHALSVTVTNLSAFAVTITEIGVSMHKRDGLIQSILFRPLDGRQFPHRLEARAEVKTASGTIAWSEAEMDRLQYPFAVIAGGRVFNGKFPTELLKAIREGARIEPSKQLEK